jgi:hypothetical protein
MTPDERARADAITDAIARDVQERKRQRIPGLSPSASSTEPALSRRTVFYVVLFVVITAAHVGGVLVYRHLATANAERIRIVTQEAIEARQSAEANARAEAERLKQAFTTSNLRSNTATIPEPRPTSPSSTRRTTSQAPRPYAQAPVHEEHVQPSPGGEQRDKSADHQSVAEKHAYSYFRYKYAIGGRNYAITGIEVTVSAISAVPGWPRYRTQGEVGMEYFDGQGYKRTTRHFEVLTEEKEGRIVPADITVKG